MEYLLFAMDEREKVDDVVVRTCFAFIADEIDKFKEVYEVDD